MEGHTILLGGSGKSGKLLSYSFPHIAFVQIPSLPVQYPFSGRWFFLNILFQVPVIVYNTITEHIILKRLVKQYRLETVISDNRYGLFNRRTRNIIITHQLSPVLPLFLQFAEYPLHLILKMLIHRFEECWVPDFEGNSNLTGKLSHRYRIPRNVRFIGPLSRFSIIKPSRDFERFDIVIIVSGPQPALSRITKNLIKQVYDTGMKTLIIGGLQKPPEFYSEKQGIRYIAHLNPEPFRFAVENASLIIATAGYSGIMDLITLGRSALLIPVNGQTEQEYLCRYLCEQKLFISVNESAIDLRKISNYIEKLELCHKFEEADRKIMPILKGK